MAFAYPVALELTGRRCVVVGQGPLAENKVRGLLDAAAIVAVIAPSAYRRGDLAGAFLVIAATGDRALNRAVFAEAEAAGRRPAALAGELADLDTFPDPAADPGFYVDYDETGPYEAAVGTGECAGV